MDGLVVSSPLGKVGPPSRVNGVLTWQPTILEQQTSTISHKGEQAGVAVSVAERNWAKAGLGSFTPVTNSPAVVRIVYNDEVDEAATKNNCYLCSLNGRALTECCILVPGSKPTQYLNGHNRKRAQVVCEWFDGKYKEGSAERAAKVAEAGRVRGNALQLFSKRKKKMKSTS